MVLASNASMRMGEDVYGERDVGNTGNAGLSVCYAHGRIGRQ